MNIPLMGGALLAALLSTGQAMAASVRLGAVTEARVTLSDLSYTVEDLRAHDGVDPLLRWDGAWTLTASAADATQAGWLGGLPAWDNTPERAESALAPAVGLEVASLNRSGLSSGRVTGTGLRVLDVNAQVSDGQQAGAGAGYGQAFTLGAGTQV